MKDTILGEIYNSLTKEELKKLNKYIRHSEWRESETIVKCHELYYYSIKEKKELEFNKKELFDYIYPGEKYTDNKLRFTQNRLLNAIKQFTVNYEFEKENVFTNKIWMDFLIDRRLKKNLQYHNQENNFVSQSEYRYLNDFFKSQEESLLSFQYPKEQAKQYTTIQNVINKAQLFSDLVFIRNFCSLISFSLTFKAIPVELPIDKLEKIRERTDIELYPEFRVYLAAIDLLIKKDEESYFSYKKKLFETLENWEEQEKINLLIYLLNYTTQQLNQGKQEYLDEQYNLFLEFEKRKIFQIKNYINHTRINNVVIIYLRKKEFEKAENFLNSHINLLDENLRSSCLHFNIARIKFEKKSYKECLRDLLFIDFSKDAFYSFNSKILLLKSYYELNESDALDSLIVSFKEFTKKNKIVSETYKQNCLSFLSLTKKLYASTDTALNTILKSIETTATVEKIWLFEKVNERIKNKKAKS